MSVSRDMELRHLEDSKVLRLSEILDRNQSWARLMENIPRNLSDITKIQQRETSLQAKDRKYSSDNIR